jgi:hypothetical protein
MPKPKRKPADRIRALLDEGVAPDEVCRTLRVTRAAVRSADQHRQPKGRPVEKCSRRLTLYVDAETLDWLRAEADRTGYTPGELVDGMRLAIQAADRGDDPILAAHVTTHATKDTAS